MANDHFGWPEFYEDPDGYFDGIEAEKKADARRQQERAAELRRQAWNRKLSMELRLLADRGIEQVKGLSYRKIVFLECWLGIGEVTAQERIQELQEAERLDKERR